MINTKFHFILALCLALFSIACQSSTAQTKKMVFAIDLIRHGDRSPVTLIPKTNHVWEQGRGQLTPEGMNQEYELGKVLHERYIEHYHLLPESYSAETMYVRASDIDRTLMSAECVLLGLYPPGSGPTLEGHRQALPSGYQPIPIHTIPRSEDSMLVIDSNPKLHQCFEQYVWSSQDWKEHSAAVEPEFKHWSEVTGLPITKFTDVGGLGDSIHVCQIHKVALPIGMTEKDATQIRDSESWMFAKTFEPVQVGECAAHELLTAITNYLDQANKKDSKLKYVLFSAHDTTIASLLSALHAPVKERPRYASDLNISLIDFDGQLKVKILFNGEPVNIPGATDGVSTLAQFDALTHHN